MEATGRRTGRAPRCCRGVSLSAGAPEPDSGCCGGGAVSPGRARPGAGKGLVRCGKGLGSVRERARLCAEKGSSRCGKDSAREGLGPVRGRAAALPAASAPAPRVNVEVNSLIERAL